jgi:hypothetical protein
MRKAWIVAGIVMMGFVANAQNLELRNGKDFKQPGKINPALAGVQGDFIRVLTDADIGNSFQIMLDGKIPFKLGNYMVGYERLSTDNVQDNMINITYGNKTKNKDRKKDFQFRYGVTAQIHTKSLLEYGFDSTSKYNFVDINGETKNVADVNDLKDAINYANIQVGGGINYKNLFATVGLDNIISPNVSLVENDSRKLPLSGNLVVGGFLNAGKNFTIFPSVLVDYSDQNSYGKASIGLASEKITFSASYIMENDIVSSQEFSGALAYRYKKNALIGLQYTHPVSGGAINALPRYNIYLNASIFKGPKLFMSELSKQMQRFY